MVDGLRADVAGLAAAETVAQGEPGSGRRPRAVPSVTEAQAEAAVVLQLTDEVPVTGAAVQQVAARLPHGAPVTVAALVGAYGGQGVTRILRERVGRGASQHRLVGVQAGRVGGAPAVRPPRRCARRARCRRGHVP